MLVLMFVLTFSLMFVLALVLRVVLKRVCVFVVWLWCGGVLWSVKQTQHWSVSCIPRWFGAPSASNTNTGSSLRPDPLLSGPIIPVFIFVSDNRSVFESEQVSHRRDRVTQLRDLLLSEGTCRPAIAVVVSISGWEAEGGGGGGGGGGETRCSRNHL